jgi:hypothetical protein
MRRMMLWLIAGPLGRRSSLIAVRYRSARGKLVALPVQAARDGAGGFDVAVADAARKSWWRHFRRPAPLEVLADGEWRAATGVVAPEGADAAHRSRYAARFPGIRLNPGTRMVRLDLERSAAEAAHGGVQS